VRAGATRFQHNLRQLALLVILGRPPRCVAGIAGYRQRQTTATPAKSSQRGRGTRIAARLGLSL
jgi:hypothetical protein